jgi:tRNA A37 threonylcarbamoyladenosine dehydratase
VDTPSLPLNRERAFGGIQRLYGAQALKRLQQAHVTVVGLGGVGSWAAEALVRSGVGQLKLIDLDHVAESNLNRQAQALTSTLGQAKVVALAERLRLINPDCQLQCVEEFLSADLLPTLLSAETAVLDAIDEVRTKAALAAYCRDQGLPLVMCGAAGGKTDASRVRIVDLALTHHDRLLSRVRSRLRKDYGFPGAQVRAKKMGVCAVYVDQHPATAPACTTGSALSCAGYGSAMHVTASVGMAAAGQLLNWLTQNMTFSKTNTP